MANVIKGKDFMLFVVVNGEIKPVCYDVGATLAIQHEYIDTTTKQNSKFRQNRYKRASYTISHSGNLNAVPGNASYFQQAILNGDTIFWTFTDSVNFQWTGQANITSYSFDSPVDGLSSFNVELVGTGELECEQLPTANTDPDQSGSEGGSGQPVIEYVTIQDQTGAIIAQVPAPGIYNVTRFNQIGGGSSVARNPGLVITPYHVN